MSFWTRAFCSKWVFYDRNYLYLNGTSCVLLFENWTFMFVEWLASGRWVVVGTEQRAERVISILSHNEYARIHVSASFHFAFLSALKWIWLLNICCRCRIRPLLIATMRVWGSCYSPGDDKLDENPPPGQLDLVLSELFAKRINIGLETFAWNSVSFSFGCELVERWC